MKELIIIAAGNAKRMGNIDVPKALYPINGVPNIVNTLNLIRDKFDSVRIVVKEGMEEQFRAVLPNDRLDTITSGLGDGHAIMQTLRRNVANDCVIIWGDTYLSNADLIDELLALPTPGERNPLIVPVVSKFQPYVSIICEVDVGQRLLARAANFSKNGEICAKGYHDQSVFRGHGPTLLHNLYAMDAVMWKNGRYISESGELNFLHILHLLSNRMIPANVFITSSQTMGFNTVDDVELIEYMTGPDYKEL